MATSESKTGRAAVEPDPGPAGRVERAAVWIAEGLSAVEVAARAGAEWGCSGDEGRALAKTARKGFADAGRPTPAEALGIAVARFELLYARALEAGQIKAALDAQRALIELLGIGPPTVADFVALARLELAAAGAVEAREARLAAGKSGTVPRLELAAEDGPPAAAGREVVGLEVAPDKPRGFAAELRLLREKREAASSA